MPILETSRLVLRRWDGKDIVPMAEINADPEVMRWIGGGTTRTEEQTKRAIEHWENEWNTQGYGLLAVEVKESGELAGFVGISVPTFLPEVMPAVEIGWRLGRSFWGKGIATEAAREVLRFGFVDCGLTEILSICQVGNDASERIMQKLGMHLERETIDPTCGRPVKVYAITSPVAK
ncbi:GNAT family N-acetyltransferase [Alicyclobacillus fastidiosus]|uniref:GNAT family N-acetyltransferase n=1 Tax=Alicyclobacillus fastidiosus TaxID=392011 RepID=A0ABV5AKD5_9BACL|nr:GNAT family N-acetyltransferase [Alicyclobacillus fastidiosus]WEH10044.1 GNAT family N-acetyltransferase [Alicyclobacillus fastidiosus]